MAFTDREIEKEFLDETRGSGKGATRSIYLLHRNLRGRRVSPTPSLSEIERDIEDEENSWLGESYLRKESSR